MTNNQNQTIFSKYKLESFDVKSKLLTRSLLWMSLGLIVIILVAWISSTNSTFFDLVLNLSVGTDWIYAWIINIVIMVLLFVCLNFPKIPIIVPSILYVAFAFYEGIFITSILIFSGSTNEVKDLLLYMLIPASVFAIMGILGYLNLLNFTKLLPFIFFGSIALLILALTLIFTSNWVVETTYLFLAAALFIIWIGVDMQIIMRTQKSLDANNGVDKKQMNKLSLMLGINLFVDFVRLLSIIIRISRFIRD